MAMPFGVAPWAPPTNTRRKNGHVRQRSGGDEECGGAPPGASRFLVEPILSIPEELRIRPFRLGAAPQTMKRGNPLVVSLSNHERKGSDSRRSSFDKLSPKRVAFGDRVSGLQGMTLMSVSFSTAISNRQTRE